MIGSVTFEARGTRHTATLAADGSWSFELDLPDDLFGTFVRDVCRSAVESYPGPQGGPFGPAQLAEVADRLGGEARIEPIEPDPPGLVY